MKVFIVVEDYWCLDEGRHHGGDPTTTLACCKTLEVAKEYIKSLVDSYLNDKDEDGEKLYDFYPEDVCLCSDGCHATINNRCEEIMIYIEEKEVLG